MNILSVAAHPDDTEILCAGTLIRYAREGHRVLIAVFTDGSVGDLVVPPGKMGAIRKKEAQAAADLIGAELIWPAIADEHVFPDQHQRMIMVDILRQADPDVIFTHAPNDYHPDHRYVSQLVFDAYSQKGLPYIDHQSLPPCRLEESQIYYMDTVCGIDFMPTEYVDITEVFEMKKKMLRCHKSQIRDMKEQAHTDMLGMMETQSKFRGLAAGCKYAEGFKRLEAYQRGLTRRILP
ncbi:MAG: PIG-L family deacetylase [Niabella sp.]|nr:PIG-L family deacetylase [Niabella sp.]